MEINDKARQACQTDRRMMERMTRSLPRWTATGLFASVALFFAGIGFSSADGGQAGFRPGQPWLDTDGSHINAHGYCILKHEDKYYWYGSHKIAGKTESEKTRPGWRVMLAATC